MAVALALGVSGCGSSDSGLAGVYQVTAQSKQTGGCDAPVAATTLDPPYFIVVDEDFVNGTFLEAYKCTGADKSTCDTETFPLVFLAESIGGGKYLAESMSRQGCSATWNGDYIEKTPDGVNLRSETRSGTLTGSDCTDDLLKVSAKGRTLECRSLELTVGKRL